MSRAGRKAFDRCDVKVVELKDYVFTDDDRTKSVRSVSPSEDNRDYAGSAAVLHCPRTEDDRISIESQFSDHSTRLAANDSLREIAGALVCRDCMYSDMTPVQVSIARKELAAAERERIIAFSALEAARAELDSIDPTTL